MSVQLQLVSNMSGRWKAECLPFGQWLATSGYGEKIKADSLSDLVFCIEEQDGDSSRYDKKDDGRIR